jgi:hypothetical protein
MFYLYITEVEQRHVITFADVKKFGLRQIVAEHTSVYGEQGCPKKTREHWIHQVKLGRMDMNDEARPGRLPLDDVGAIILACLSREPFSSVRSIAQALGIAPATIH